MTCPEAIAALFDRNGWDGGDDSKITLKQGDLKRLLEQFYKIGSGEGARTAKWLNDIVGKATNPFGV